MRYLLFTIDSGRYAIASQDVAEIVRAVAVMPLPGAPPVIIGIIDVRGSVVSVLDMRHRFGLARRAVMPADHFIIVRTASRSVALHVDGVLELIDVDATSIADVKRDVRSAAYVEGAALLPDGLALIHDVETFLSQAEADVLDIELAARDSGGHA